MSQDLNKRKLWLTTISRCFKIPWPRYLHAIEPLMERTILAMDRVNWRSFRTEHCYFVNPWDTRSLGSSPVVFSHDEIFSSLIFNSFFCFLSRKKLWKFINLICREASRIPITAPLQLIIWNWQNRVAKWYLHGNWGHLYFLPEANQHSFQKLPNWRGRHAYSYHITELRSKHLHFYLQL